MQLNASTSYQRRVRTSLLWKGTSAPPAWALSPSFKPRGSRLLSVLKYFPLKARISLSFMWRMQFWTSSRLGLLTTASFCPYSRFWRSCSTLRFYNGSSEVISSMLSAPTSFPFIMKVHWLTIHPLLDCLRWRNFLSLVQKAHFKSNNMQKLYLALDVYRGLANVPAIRQDVRTKLTSMLLHPFPKVRPGYEDNVNRY